MDREKLAFAMMTPFDFVLGKGVSILRSTGGVERVTDPMYTVAAKALTEVYRRTNDLEAKGLDHVPLNGGVIFACNHQSWADVQVIAATCPRRVRFLTKDEFRKWPVLRHFIELTDCPYIRRGGDAQGLSAAIDLLKQGKALVVFPEGTIPGEEDIARHEVEFDTGLLRGKTGAVRMAIAARVPIVPVGISGTGRSFPPETYPRLEMLEPPKPVPMTVHYGAPIRFEQYKEADLTPELFRSLTKSVMLDISKLVDHERNYVPLSLPIEPLPQVEKLGVLLLHGFTSSVRTVDGLVPYLEQAGLPYRMPVLRGHGSCYTDLENVTAQDWYDDAEVALLDLAQEVDRVAVVGLSMGGLVSLNLGIRHPDKIAGIVTLAAALRFVDPLAGALPLISRWVKDWASPNAFNDPSLKATSENYPRFMTKAFESLLNYARETELRLSQVSVPLCVLQSKADQVVSPISANIIYRDVSSAWREIHWFARSGHEMGQDLERQQVFECVMKFVGKLKKEPLRVSA